MTAKAHADERELDDEKIIAELERRRERQDKRTPTSEQKAFAWRLSAVAIESWLDRSIANQAVADHIRSSVIPSLRRRAEIIKRRDTHAKRRKGR